MPYEVLQQIAAENQLSKDDREALWQLYNECLRREIGSEVAALDSIGSLRDDSDQFLVAKKFDGEGIRFKRQFIDEGTMTNPMTFFLRLSYCFNVVLYVVSVTLLYSLLPCQTGGQVKPGMK